MNDRLNGNASPIVWARKHQLLPRDYSLHIPEFKMEWIDRVKRVPNAKWDQKLSCWLVPRNEENRRLLQQLYGASIYIES